MKTLVLATCLLISQITHAEETWVSGQVIKVYDGDTVTLKVTDSIIKCRLYGIDAPELKQPFGKEAQKYLASLILNRRISVQLLSKDFYGRHVCKLYQNTLYLNRHLVATGYAWWYQAYAKKEVSLGDVQLTAQENKFGLWADEEPEAPWTFRKLNKK